MNVPAFPFSFKQVIGLNSKFHKDKDKNHWAFSVIAVYLHLMKQWICSFLLLTLAVIASTASAVDTCNSGVQRCAPLQKDAPKYNRCMELVCSPDPGAKKQLYTRPTKEQQSYNFSTCTTGLYRCANLADNSLFYWGCMKDTCYNPENQDLQLNCFEGQRQCYSHNKSYQLCINLICGTALNSKETCEEGKRECTDSYQHYWKCMSNTCLGDTEKYRDYTRYYSPEVVKKRENLSPAAKALLEDKKTFTSANPQFHTPPKGVDPIEWSSILPRDRVVSANPASQAKCPPGESMYCPSRDIMDCVCSGGTRPKSKFTEKSYRPEQRSNYYYDFLRQPTLQ